MILLTNEDILTKACCGNSDDGFILYDPDIDKFTVENVSESDTE